MTYHAPTENGAEKLPCIQYPLIWLVVDSPLPRQLVLPGTIDEKLVSALKNVCPMLAVSLGRDVATDEACMGAPTPVAADSATTTGRGAAKEGVPLTATADGGGAEDVSLASTAATTATTAHSRSTAASDTARRRMRGDAACFFPVASASGSRAHASILGEAHMERHI